MKKGLWMIFKCQNCGKVFQEKPPKWDYQKERIGRYTHIISTHRCGPGKSVYGCAVLIGIKDWDAAKEVTDDSNPKR